MKSPSLPLYWGGSRNLSVISTPERQTVYLSVQTSNALISLENSDIIHMKYQEIFQTLKPTTDAFALPETTVSRLRFKYFL